MSAVMDKTRSLSDNRFGGLALLASVALLVVVYAFQPGAGLVDTADPSDLYALTAAMVENAGLTHVTSMLVSLALLLQVYGIVVIWRNAGDGGSGVLVRFGLAAIVVSIVFLLAGRGMDHVIVHVSEHGIGRGTGGAEQATLDQTALTVQAVKAGLRVISPSVGLLGFAAFAAGMSARFSGMTAHSVLPVIVVVTSLAGLGSTVTVEDHHEIIDPLQPISAALVIFTLIYTALVGWGPYQGIGGYVKEEAAVG